MRTTRNLLSNSPTIVYVLDIRRMRDPLWGYKGRYKEVFIGSRWATRVHDYRGNTGWNGVLGNPGWPVLEKKRKITIILSISILLLPLSLRSPPWSRLGWLQGSLDYMSIEERSGLPLISGASRRYPYQLIKIVETST